MNVAGTKIYPILVSFFFLANLALSSLGQFFVPPHSHGTETAARAVNAEEKRAFRTPHQHWAMVDQNGSLVWYSVYNKNFGERPVTARIGRQEFSADLASIVSGGWQTVRCGEKTSSLCYCCRQEFRLSLQPADKEIKVISRIASDAGFIPSIGHIPIEV